MSLEEYQEKRRFSRTPEPEANRTEAFNREPIFVVQKHEASHLHFDFRLEAEGVLKSWAVPKGPSMNPKDKRLAVQVEDHPLSYANFEGIIPKGEYGAGSVEIWDRGTFSYIEKDQSIEEAISRGVVGFILHGHKLKGLFTLVRTDMNNENKNWLLIKKEDRYAVHVPYDAIGISSPD